MTRKLSENWDGKFYARKWESIKKMLNGKFRNREVEKPKNEVHLPQVRDPGSLEILFLVDKGFLSLTVPYVIYFRKIRRSQRIKAKFIGPKLGTRPNIIIVVIL